VDREFIVQREEAAGRAIAAGVRLIDDRQAGAADAVWQSQRDVVQQAQFDVGRDDRVEAVGRGGFPDGDMAATSIRWAGSA
jgi:hypothetical protein